MFYRKNVGSTERAVRGIAGTLLIAGGLLGLGLTPPGLLAAGAGVVALVTGLVGFCPACALAGRRLRDPRA